MIISKFYNLSALLVISFLILASCSDDKTSPNDSKLIYDVKMNPSSIATPYEADSNNIELLFTDASFSLEEVYFHAGSNKTEIEIESNTKTRLNLLTGESSPVLPQLSLAKGTYENIKFGLKLDNEKDDYALLLKGVFTDSEDISIPFELRISDYLEIELQSESNLEFEGKELVEIKFNAERIFDSIDSALIFKGSKDQNNILVISEDDNSSLYEMILKNLKDNGEDDSLFEVNIEFEN
ncbi:hypothetical protein [Marinigracilibium pacificum]|uniref:DUF4382 domain-containing protein n=1 Tax=Marinigracilibium pacificum TaxID=2729599 RepID=A0A848J648_9BACT|nr:hypothetical protein [Marinigracilibium pacificum]NMM49990.1 hypothetical protein [Marinigracilibium pacificum]